MLIRRILMNRDSLFFRFFIFIIFINFRSCQGRHKYKPEVCSKYNLDCIPHWKCPKDGGYIKKHAPVKCGFDDGNIWMCCNSSYSFQNPTTTSPEKTTPIHKRVTPVPLNPTQIRFKNATAIAALNCEKYANHRYSKEWLSPQLPGDKGDWYDRLQCDNDFDELPTGGEIVRPTQYPHMARIGYGNHSNDIRWNCDGSLISERFILSAAQCGKTSRWGTPRWVLLGTSFEQFVQKGNRATVYEIANVYDHPSYNPRSLYHDISLFELKTTVVMSPYIRPACLSAFINIPGLRGRATGFRQSDNLIGTSVMVQDDTTCHTSYWNRNNIRIHRVYDPFTMICTADDSGVKSSCEGNFGGPLQMKMRDKMCLWNICGVMSFGKVCSNVHDGDLAIYTKVEYYIVWIQSIVWP